VSDDAVSLEWRASVINRDVFANAKDDLLPSRPSPTASQSNYLPSRRSPKHSGGERRSRVRPPWCTSRARCGGPGNPVSRSELRKPAYFGLVFLFSTLRNQRKCVFSFETYASSRSGSDSFQKQVCFSRKSQHTSFFEKTTFSLRFVLLRRFLSTGQNRKTTFSIRLVHSRVLSGGQSSRRHSPLSTTD
jgi:hypothetical protein